MSSVGFDYRPTPREWKPYDQMPQFTDKRMEREWESWRRDMILRVYGPQEPLRPRKPALSSAQHRSRLP